MTVKTAVSRFHIHDELTAPEASLPILRTVLLKTTTLSNFLGVLANSPLALRLYARLRAELRGSHLDPQLRERLALGVAQRRGDEYSVFEHARLARAAGLGLDEITRARRFESTDPKVQSLLRFCQAVIDSRGQTPVHLHEEARESGWTDEQILEAVAQLGLSEFESLVSNAAGLPRGDTVKRAVLPAAA